jgi:lipopolysaccharide export system protein LptA
VDDKRQIATFRGNVVARQGDYAIRSQELTVTYKKKSTPTAAEKHPGANPLSEGGADIRFLDAKGEVSVTRAQGFQRARSNSAHFDVRGQTIELFDGVAVSDG